MPATGRDRPDDPDDPDDPGDPGDPGEGVRRSSALRRSSSLAHGARNPYLAKIACPAGLATDAIKADAVVVLVACLVTTSE